MGAQMINALFVLGIFAVCYGIYVLGHIDKDR